jgi:hypothetical protein
MVLRVAIKTVLQSVLNEGKSCSGGVVLDSTNELMGMNADESE